MSLRAKQGFFAIWSDTLFLFVVLRYTVAVFAMLQDSVISAPRARGVPPWFLGMLQLATGALLGWWYAVSHTLLSLVCAVVISLFVDGIFIRLCQTPLSISKPSHWLSLAMFRVGWSFLLLITDQTSVFGERLVRWWVLWFLMVLLPSLSFFSIPKVRSELVFMARPHMRIGVGLIMLGIGGVAAAASAAMTFNLFAPSWWLMLVAAVACWSAGGAVVAWRWYARDMLWVRVVRAAVFMMWLMFQMVAVFVWWPIGFLWTAILTAWVWYIVWLTMRYAMSEDGISWPRHGYFLAAHALSMGIVLALCVRW